MLLLDLAVAVRGFGAFVRGEADDVPVSHPAQLEESIESVRELRARLTDLLLVDPRTDENLWELNGAMLSSIERVLAEIDLERRLRERDRRLESMEENRTATSAAVARLRVATRQAADRRPKMPDRPRLLKRASRAPRVSRGSRSDSRSPRGPGRRSGCFRAARPARTVDADGSGSRRTLDTDDRPESDRPAGRGDNALRGVDLPHLGRDAGRRGSRRGQRLSRRRRRVVGRAAPGRERPRRGTPPGRRRGRRCAAAAVERPQPGTRVRRRCLDGHRGRHARVRRVHRPARVPP